MPQARTLTLAGVTLTALFTPAFAAPVALATVVLPTLAVCESRANATADLLAACVQTPWVRRHLVKFQAIATANPDAAGHGNRDAGSAGYAASVAYVEKILRRAGYAVHRQPYQFSYTTAAAQPVLRVGGHAMRLGQSWFAAIGTGAGTVQALAQGLGRDAQASGCAAQDFVGFTTGKIALMPQGGCPVGAKVANATAAGARGVIVYRRDQAAMADAASITSTQAAAPARLASDATIPVAAFVSARLGADLRAAYLAGTNAPVTLAITTQKITVHDINLIADAPPANTTGGTASRVVVVDAHLDSIFGPGILDNASGCATILEIALKLAHTPTRNALRYVFFGGEELGLHGSAYYTRHLDAAEAQAIAFDIDVDVTATPNFDVLIADPGHASNVAKFPPNVVAQSQPGNQAFATVLGAAGIAARIAGFGNDGTDSNAFSLVGIPNSGILTQQDCCKSLNEVRVWGGFTGNYEGRVPGRDGGCVDNPGRWCDDISNINSFVLGFASKATAQVVLQMANTAFNAAKPVITAR